MPAAIPRQLKITTEMLDKFGYTANCVRCRGLLGHGPAPTSAHEPHCRRRIEAKLQDDEKFRDKLTERRQKLDGHNAPA
eukprot:1130723-Heterocapsa_arctica.AAC.1